MTAPYEGGPPAGTEGRARHQTGTPSETSAYARQCTPRTLFVNILRTVCALGIFAGAGIGAILLSRTGEQWLSLAALGLILAAGVAITFLLPVWRKP